MPQKYEELRLAWQTGAWHVPAMPQRPSKKPRVQPATKSGIVKDLAGHDQASQQKHREKTTKAILGKFQGRKSI